MRSLIDGHVSQANSTLERWETVKRFVLLDHELSVDEGEVTPSMKVRRRAVERKYDQVLAGLYDSE